MNTPKAKNRIIIFSIAVLATLLVIFVFSAMNGGNSNGVSDPIVNRLIDFLIDDYETLPAAEAASVRKLFVLLVRKGAHFLSYAVLGMFAFLGCREICGVFILKKKNAWLYSLMFCVAAAALDELHQSFVPGRNPSPADILIDAAGSLCAIVFFCMVFAISAKLLMQLIRFTIVGGTVFLIDYFLLYFFWDKMELMYVLAATCSFIISTVINYILSMTFVFQSRENMSKTKEFIIFAILNLIGLGLNALLLMFFVEIVGIYVMISKIFVAAIVMFWSFISRKVFLEKH